MARCKRKPDIRAEEQMGQGAYGEAGEAPGGIVSAVGWVVVR